ncbi:WD40 repeat-like protein [Neoconidiobolus thromboides FSU 785]|nr:WD40 repeat-like protein [Neoconidiobolus thromboides FSU 785]
MEAVNQRKKKTRKKKIISSLSAPEPTPSHELSYLTPLSTMDITPITNLTQTIKGITQATSQLLFSPSTFQQLLLNILKKSVGGGNQNRITSGEEGSKGLDMDVDDDIDSVYSNGNTLYSGFIHKDERKDDTPESSVVNGVGYEESESGEGSNILLKLKKKEKEVETIKAKIKSYDDKMDKIMKKKNRLELELNQMEDDLNLLSLQLQPVVEDNEAQEKDEIKETDDIETPIANIKQDEKEEINQVVEFEEFNETIEEKEEIKIEITMDTEEVHQHELTSVKSVEGSVISNNVYPMIFKAHDSIVNSIHSDEKTQLLATSEVDGNIKLWDMKAYDSYENLYEIPAKFGNVYDIKINDGILIGGGKDSNLRIYNTRSLLEVTEQICNKEEEEEIIEKPLLSPNLLPSLSPNSLKPESELSIYSAPPSFSLPPAQALPSFTLKGHKSYIKCLDMDCNYALSGSNDGTIKQWDLENGKLISTFDCTWQMNLNSINQKQNKIISVLESKGNNYNILNSIVGTIKFYSRALASGTNDGIIRMWDLRTGQCHRSLAGHQNNITSLNFDTFHLISGSLDHTVKIFDLRTGKQLESIKYEDIVLDLQFNSKNIFTSCDKEEVEVYQRTTFQKKQLSGLQSTSWGLHLTRDNLLIGGTKNGYLRFWNVNS